MLDTKPLERLEPTQTKFVEGVACLAQVLHPGRRTLGQLLSQEQPNPGVVELEPREIGEVQTAGPLATGSTISPLDGSIHPDIKAIASTTEGVDAQIGPQRLKGSPAHFVSILL